MTQTPANWYPDANQPGVERFWDGAQWTNQTRATPATAPPPQQFAPPPQVASPQAAPPQKGGVPTAVKVLIGLLVVLVLGFAGCIALIEAVGDNLNELQDEIESSEQLVQDAAKLSNCELGEFGTAKVTVDITNPFDETKGFIFVEVNFLDGDTVVGSGTAIFENLDAGQSAVGEATAFDLADGVTSVRCEVVDGSAL